MATKKKPFSDLAKNFYGDLRKLLAEFGPKEVVNVLAELFLVEPPKVIVGSKELKKYCPPFLPKKYFKNCGYFLAPNTLILDKYSAKCIFTVTHEFLHYVDFILMQAVSGEEQVPLQKRSEDITRKKCEYLGRLLHSAPETPLTPV